MGIHLYFLYSMTKNRMYNFKTVTASQAKNTHKYKNINLFKPSSFFMYHQV
jgi:hypothetical protein